MSPSPAPVLRQRTPSASLSDIQTFGAGLRLSPATVKFWEQRRWIEGVRTDGAHHAVTTRGHFSVSPKPRCHGDAEINENMSDTWLPSERRAAAT